MANTLAAGKLEPTHSGRIWTPPSVPEGQRLVFYFLSLDWSCPQKLKGFMDFSVKSLATAQEGVGSQLWVGNLISQT